MKRTRIVVTGANGMLGRAIQRAFQDISTYEVVQYGRANSDLSTMSGLLKFHEFLDRCQPWYVIHTASIVGGIEMNDRYPYTFHMKNTIMNAGVVNSCIELNVPRFLGILSVCCYGEGFEPEQYPLTEDRFFEKEPHHTNSGYAYSKRNLALHILTANKEYNKHYNYVIPTNLYGIDDFRGYRAHYCSVMLDKVINALSDNNNKIIFEGDGRVKRQYLYVDDLANIIKRHVMTDVDENYNVSPDEELSAEEMIQTLLSKKNLNLSYEFKNTMVTGQFQRTVDTSRVKKLYPDFSFTPFSEGVEKVFNNWVPKGLV